MAVNKNGCHSCDDSTTSEESINRELRVRLPHQVYDISSIASNESAESALSQSSYVSRDLVNLTVDTTSSTGPRRISVISVPYAHFENSYRRRTLTDLSNEDPRWRWNLTTAVSDSSLITSTNVIENLLPRCRSAPNLRCTR